MIILVLQNTPRWVWGVLALTIWLGAGAMKPRAVRLWRMSLLPAGATAWCTWKIATSALVVPILTAWALTLLAGALVGFCWAASLSVKPADRGQLQLPGTSVWLVFGLVSFGLFYALNVFLAFHPELRSALEWIVAPYLLGGLGTGLTWGWFLGLFKHRQAMVR